ncbi:sensor histidine kinase [Bdellovibrio sp. SKB1291214]|uniref:sensor histidine kinase n=1 Tax=Bdellovibrio sp. SKB1291214 TaxID=1732569 RepID=UPI001595312D|nr:sensor histidine kinase [Bdellovibrio sp. SKB1291214]UYL09567.1 sensor histidine kinase [Bdellovibrio sp. SKB1291214]
MAALVAISVLSFVVEVRRAQGAVAQYFAIWEEDIAKSLLVKQDSTLLDKILGQLKEVHSSVEQVSVKAKSEHCAFENDIPITLFSLPAGQVQVCYSSADLAFKTVSSPIFLIGIFLGLVFVSFGSRRDLLNRLKEQKLHSELERNREISEISRQVAHDIRGPLMALTTLTTLSHEMSHEKKELLGLAVGRIRGIADDLLLRSRTQKLPDSAIQEVAKPAAKIHGVDIIQAANSLLKEYRFSYPNIEFTWHQHVKAEKLIMPLDEMKMMRVLGNILNNSVEAAPESEASISVSLLDRDQNWLLQIMDNGSGIPEDVLPQLMEEGKSFGKENGNGLGLYDARKTLQAVGGDLQLRSRVGVGTQVIMIIPKHFAMTTEKIS